MEDALFATIKEKSTDFTNINDLIQVSLLNSGDIVIIYDDTIRPPIFRTAILESITHQEESFKTIILNFTSVEGEKFILRKFYKGTIDVFSPLVVLGGELFDKYKLFKVENHSIGLEQLVEKFKKLVQDSSVVFNSSMPIENQPKTSIVPEGAERGRLNSVGSQLAEGGRLTPSESQLLGEGGRLSASGSPSLGAEGGRLSAIGSPSLGAEGGRLSASGSPSLGAEGGRLSPKEQAGLAKRAAQIAKAKEREQKMATKSSSAKVGEGSSGASAAAGSSGASAAAGSSGASAAAGSSGAAPPGSGVSSFRKVEPTSNKQKYIKYKNKYINLKNELLN
jgi:hypothetical protein